MDGSKHFSEVPRNTAPPARAAGTPQLFRFDSLLEDWRNLSEELHRAKKAGEARGPVTGLPKLDHVLGGVLTPGLHGLHGQTAMGKTAFCLQVAARCGVPALYLTTEMGVMELVRRTIARETGAYLNTLRTGEREPSDSVNLFLMAKDKVPNLVFADGLSGAADFKWLRTACKSVKQDSEHLLVVIDSLHTWVDGAIEGAEYEGLNRGLTLLRSLSAELNASVVMVAEQNRSSKDVGGLNAGAGSRKLEYSADTVMELKKKPNSDKSNHRGETEVVIEILKNRNGAPGFSNLVFNGALQSFREVA